MKNRINELNSQIKVLKEPKKTPPKKSLTGREKRIKIVQETIGIIKEYRNIARSELIQRIGLKNFNATMLANGLGDQAIIKK
ncbi:MAG: hypothetical protein Q7K42_01330, partial [Candidatus Diapherotrites archaeon]|nr:hypothetical protein [Candidatus Diapherotrites archaeon]